MRSNRLIKCSYTFHSQFQTGGRLEIYLVDGTYELFRHYYAVPSARDENGIEVAAVRGVLASVLGMIKEGATHVAVATDHVIGDPPAFATACRTAKRAADDGRIVTFGIRPEHLLVSENGNGVATITLEAVEHLGDMP